MPLKLEQIISLPRVIPCEPDVGNPAAVHKSACFHGGQSGERRPRRVRRKGDLDAAANGKVLLRPRRY